MSWIKALRLRTLPLAVASISMGAFLAASAGKFNPLIFILCCLTTLLLQILSNLSNDYGDSLHGADHAGRKGPMRMVQSGAISPQKMQAAIVFVFRTGVAVACAWKRLAAVEYFSWDRIVVHRCRPHLYFGKKTLRLCRSRRPLCFHFFWISCRFGNLFFAC